MQKYKVLTPIQYDKERREVGFLGSFKKLSDEAKEDLVKQKILKIEEIEEIEEETEKIYKVIKSDKVKIEGATDFLEEGVGITEKIITEKPISNMLNWGWIEEVK